MSLGLNSEQIKRVLQLLIMANDNQLKAIKDATIKEMNKRYKNEYRKTFRTFKG